MLKSNLTEVQRDFELFNQNRNNYNYKLQEISNHLDFKKNSFIKDQLPTYFVGDITSKTPKIVIVGINPGGSEKNLKKENKFKGEKFKDFLEFQKDFFSIYKNEIKLPIRYYSYLTTCLRKDDAEFENLEYFDFCQKHLINIDLIPYHSKNFRLKLNDNNIGYLRKRFFSLTNFIEELECKVQFVIVHKKILFDLLHKIEFIDLNNKVKIYNHKKEVYLKKHNGISYFIFSRFIPNGGFSRKEVQNILKSKK